VAWADDAQGHFDLGASKAVSRRARGFHANTVSKQKNAQIAEQEAKKQMCGK
jgi:hypothetical protein